MRLYIEKRVCSFYPEVHAERGVELNLGDEVCGGSVDRNRKLNGFFLQHAATAGRRGHRGGRPLTVRGGRSPLTP